VLPTVSPTERALMGDVSVALGRRQVDEGLSAYETDGETGPLARACSQVTRALTSSGCEESGCPESPPWRGCSAGRCRPGGREAIVDLTRTFPRNRDLDRQARRTSDARWGGCRCRPQGQRSRPRGKQVVESVVAKVEGYRQRCPLKGAGCRSRRAAVSAVAEGRVGLVVRLEF